MMSTDAVERVLHALSPDQQDDLLRAEDGQPAVTDATEEEEAAARAGAEAWATTFRSEPTDS